MGHMVKTVQKSVARALIRNHVITSLGPAWMAVSRATKECSAKQVLCNTQILKKMSKLISKRILMFFLAMTIGKTPQVFLILNLLSMFIFKTSDLFRIQYTRYVILSVQAFNSGSLNYSDIVPNRIYLPYTHYKWMHFC